MAHNFTPDSSSKSQHNSQIFSPDQNNQEQSLSPVFENDDYQMTNQGHTAMDQLAAQAYFQNMRQSNDHS